jgi:hypothetical protein
MLLAGAGTARGGRIAIFAKSGNLEPWILKLKPKRKPPLAFYPLSEQSVVDIVLMRVKARDLCNHSCKNKALRRSTRGGKISLRRDLIVQLAETEYWMPGTRGWIILGLWLAAPALVARGANTPAPAAAPTPHTHHKSHKTLKPLALPPLPSGPLSQLPMDQLPPVPAQVSYQGGLLSIAAQNSTLGEILGEVRKRTGATIDIPPGSGANERVVVSLGPGEPRDVLARLLNGSSFNYVMVGSNADPNAVASLILMVKPATSGEPQPAVAPTVAAEYETTTPEPPSPFRNGFRPPEGLHVFPHPGGPPQASAQAPNASNDDKDDDDDSSDDSDDSAQPQQPQINNINNDQSDQSQPNAGPKTPEQIMQMLQRAQQPGAQPMNPVQPPPQE